MEYLYGALLLHKLGQAVTEDSLKKVIQATGKEVDEAKVKVLVTSLREVDIDKELEQAAITAPAAVAAEKPEEKKEEKEEVKPEEAAEGLSALFSG